MSKVETALAPDEHVFRVLLLLMEADLNTVLI